MKNLTIFFLLLTTKVISGGEIIPDEKIEFYQIKPDVIDHVLLRFNSYNSGSWITGDVWIRYDIIETYPDRVILLNTMGRKFNLMKAFMHIPSIDIKLIRSRNGQSRKNKTNTRTNKSRA